MTLLFCELFHKKDQTPYIAYPYIRPSDTILLYDYFFVHNIAWNRFYFPMIFYVPQKERIVTVHLHNETLPGKAPAGVRLLRLNIS